MMRTNNFWRFATILFLSLMAIPVLFQSCVGQGNDERKTAESLFVDSLRPKTKLNPLVQPRKPNVYARNEQSEKVFVHDEVMPFFPGGDKALMEFIENNLHCPKKMLRIGANGRVIVSFVVEKDGSITEPKVVKTTLKYKSGKPYENTRIIKQCEEEALRIVKMMPRWIPGKQCGVPVRVKYHVPFRFNSPQPKSR